MFSKVTSFTGRPDPALLFMVSTEPVPQLQGSPLTGTAKDEMITSDSQLLLRYQEQKSQSDESQPP